MTDTQATTEHYSAEIDMWIDCGEYGQVPLEQAASTFVITALPVSIPACIARIVLMIDGRRHERPVRLVSGLSPGVRKAMISAHDDVAPF
ncbi:MAG TPA: hypothetical protein VH475_10100 [Tepidisphaeraceae bacterium]|jgi:hypothetical protein